MKEIPRRLRVSCRRIGIIWALASAFAPNAFAVPSKYQTFFDQDYIKYKSNFDSAAASGVGQTYYYFQPALMGTLSMYEATGNIVYLERVLIWAETMVSKATITKGPYKSWRGDWDYMPQNGVPTSSNLNFLQGSTELARLVRIIRTNTSLNSKYGARATQIFEFLKQNIVQREFAFAKAWHLATANISDKTMLFAAILIDMHRAGATELEPGLTYHDYVVKVINRYLSRVSAPSTLASKGAEIWDYRILTGATYCGNAPNTVSPCSNDTSHGARWPRMLLVALQAGSSLRGIGKTPTGSTLSEHFAKLGRLFSRVIWDQSTSIPKFTNYIDGANHYFRDDGPWEVGAQIFAWSFLGIVDSGALAAGDALLDAIIAGQSISTNPSMQYNNVYWSRTGLAGNLALVRSIIEKGGLPGGVATSPGIPGSFSVQ